MHKTLIDFFFVRVGYKGGKRAKGKRLKGKFPNKSMRFEHILFYLITGQCKIRIFHP